MKLYVHEPGYRVRAQNYGIALLPSSHVNMRGSVKRSNRRKWNMFAIHRSLFPRARGFASSLKRMEKQAGRDKKKRGK